MKTFLDLPMPAPTYAKERTDLVDEFYRPVLSAAVRYDRLAGYFTSSVFLLTWEALRDFIIENDGKIRLVCSPKMQPGDADAVSGANLAEALHADIVQLLREEETRNPTLLLAALIARGKLEVKLAEWGKEVDRSARAFFHDKVGILHDCERRALSFTGSANETFMAWSSIGNIESIDVSISWSDPRDKQRVQGHIDRFERIFSGNEPGISVQALPEPVRADLVALGQEVDLEEAFKSVDRSRQEAASSSESRSLVPRKHQLRAMERWEKSDFRGILEHATGAGKTITGIMAAEHSHRDGLAPLVIVPSRELLRQWKDEFTLHSYLRPFLIGGGSAHWRRPGVLSGIVRQATDGEPLVLMAVDGTFRLEECSGPLSRVAWHLAVIADEVHRLGSPRNREALARLADTPPRRLGLSATPERAGDLEGTRALFQWFGDVIDTYTLAQGIEDGHLSRYNYHPHVVSLTEEEQERWDALTKQIGSGLGGAKGGSIPKWVEAKIHERARVAKKASQKTPCAINLILDNFTEGARWLVYCADIEHMEEVRQALFTRGVPSTEFHGDMDSSERRAVLDWFRTEGGVLVAVKCLDEGIDLPSADHALILASSKNPREFVQRRGRVLRMAPDKIRAEIFDVLVLPDLTASPSAAPTLVIGEIGRAFQFAGDAENTSLARAKLLEEMNSLDLEVILNVLGEGTEDDEG